jgi:hypothetical protein
MSKIYSDYLEAYQTGPLANYIEDHRLLGKYLTI